MLSAVAAKGEEGAKTEPRSPKKGVLGILRNSYDNPKVDRIWVL